ncbi:hypothetical protein DVDV_0481 [Desulfovibrio sp. DV]|nr:hypothetical protein DVDV_0481 [Desulfovibrio sp. DV]
MPPGLLLLSAKGRLAGVVPPQGAFRGIAALEPGGCRRPWGHPTRPQAHFGRLDDQNHAS